MGEDLCFGLANILMLVKKSGKVGAELDRQQGDVSQKIPKLGLFLNCMSCFWKGWFFPNKDLEFSFGLIQDRNLS